MVEPSNDRFAVLRRFMDEEVCFNHFLGIRVAHVEVGYVRLEVPFREEFIGDPYRRALHGGILSTLADAAGGAAVWSEVSDPKARVSTIDLRVDYLRPGQPELLFAEARVVRVGNRVGVVDISLAQPSKPSEIIATGKGVYNITVPRLR
ncbi:MAG: PaaI family thioesterase [Polyangiaceae bacterium]|nr:PaaI family thioesterase [Polyangiaceae bacterium]